MNDRIKSHILAYNEKQGYNDLGMSEEETIIETLYSVDELSREDGDDHRWWNDVFVVVEIDGMLIGFWDAETTGDNCPRDVGWEFDPSSICEVVPKQITRTTYVPIGE